MCGLCGIAGNLISTDQRAFKLLLFLAELRGEDATGVIRVAKSGGPKDLKKGKPIPYNALRQTVPASHFLYYDDDKRVKEKSLWKPNDSVAFMGHARSATIGDKNDVNNAHPFSFPNVIGMHNGTITKQFAHTTEYKTDSEALYRNINDNGIEAALNEVASYTTAYALTYLDKKNHTLNFIRNEKRPLYLAICSAQQLMMWASEEWMLKEVIKRVWNVPAPVISSPLPDVLFTFDLTVPRFWETPTTRKLNVSMPVYKYPASDTVPSNKSTQPGFEYWSGYDAEWDENDKTLAPEKTAINPGTALVATARKSNHPVSARLLFQTTTSFLPRSTFQKVLDRGCGVCSCIPDIDDPLVDSKIGWLHNTNFICEPCQTNPWVHGHLSFTKITPKTAVDDTAKPNVG